MKDIQGDFHLKMTTGTYSEVLLNNTRCFITTCLRAVLIQLRRPTNAIYSLEH